MSDVLQLWTAATPNGWKVSIMLEELIEAGVPLPEREVITVDIMNGDQFSDAFTAVSPNQKIPGLVHGSVRMMESCAILQYLGEQYPSPLYPPGSARYDVLQWLTWQAACLGPTFGNKLSYTRYMGDVPDEQKVHPLERFNTEAQRLLRVLDTQLQGKMYVCGDDFTIADIAIFPWIRGYKWSKIDITLHANVLAWTERVQDRAGVTRGLAYGVKPDEVHQWSEETKKRYAAGGSFMSSQTTLERASRKAMEDRGGGGERRLKEDKLECELHFIGNRFTRIFDRAVALFNASSDGIQEPTLLTYWDTYFGDTPILDGTGAELRTLKVIEKSAINPLSNKQKLPKLLKAAGVEHVAPATYDTIEGALSHSDSEVGVWFIKNAFGTGGNNMSCVTSEGLHNVELPKHYVIQAGVQNLALIDSKKFTARIYVLVWDGRVYLYDNGFLMIHAEIYDEASTDYRVQIDHAGYDNPDGPVKMQQLIDYSEYSTFEPRFLALLREIEPIFADAKEASSRDDYILLGIDLLLRKSGDIKLVEINTFPNFVHTQEITEHVNIPFFVAAIKTMLGCRAASLKAI